DDYRLRLDACQKYPFELYYNVEEFTSGFISQSNFSNWLMERNEIIHKHMKTINNENEFDAKWKTSWELKVEHLNLRLDRKLTEPLLVFEEPSIQHVQNDIMRKGCLEQFNR